MTDKQLLDFMRDNTATIQARANEGSPLCVELLQRYSAMREASSKDEAAGWRYLLETSIGEYQNFKMKGWI